MKTEYIRQSLTNNRIFGLDILRACAIIFVMIGHGSFLLSEQYSKVFIYFGDFDGVSIFFVLSGFLIGGILIKTLEKKQDNKKVLLNFWIRRWFRTLPPYFLILIILLILDLLFTKDFYFSKIFPLNLFTFTQNLFYRPSDYFPEAWSLSIEEWFYLLIPLIIFVFILLKQSVKKSVLITALGILILITFFRFYRYSNFSVEILSDFKLYDWDVLFRKQVITRLDSLMYGVIGAFLHYYYQSYWLRYNKILFFFGLFLLIATKFFINPPVNSMFFCVFIFSVNSFATLLLLPFMINLKTNKNRLIYKVVTKISLISYSMYLTNLSIVQWWILDNIPLKNLTFLTKYDLMNGCRFFLYWIFTISLSLIIYKYYEVPMMNLRDNKVIKKYLRF